MDSENQLQAHSLRITPIILAFVAGLAGALIVDGIKARFFPPDNTVVYVNLKEFMGKKITEYGSLNYESEAEQLYVARVFSETVEEALSVMQRKYDKPIFVGPAIVTGGIDITIELESVVAAVMSEHIDGVPKNELPNRD